MASSLIMLKRVYRFLRYNRKKKLTLAIWFLTAFYRALILLVPPKKLQPYWGIQGEESAQTDTVANYRQAVRIAKEVVRIADKTPWESKCLVRALTTQRLVHRKGIETTLYLGVGKDENGKMIAHAWIRCGEIYLTGGDGSQYSTVAMFRK